MLFKVYGKPDCPFCTKAVRILQDNNIPYQYYSIGEHLTKNELIDTISLVNDNVEIKAVPQIVYGNEYIGGYTELCDFLVAEDLV
jgi:glutaredoxin